MSSYLPSLTPSVYRTDKVLAFIGGLLLCLLIMTNGYTQTWDKPAHCRELGIPLIRNYHPYNFGGIPRLEGITEDQDGIIYFTNLSSGYISFNGENFTQIRPKTTNKKEIPSDLLILGDTMWVTSRSRPGNVGYITRDTYQQFSFDSLRIIELEDSTNVFGTFDLEELHRDIYFLKQNTGLYRFRKGEIKKWNVRGYRNLFKIHDKLYIPAYDSLYELKEDKLVSVAGWNNRELGWARVMLPLPHDNILIASSEVVYKFDGVNLDTLNNVGALIPNAQIWRGIQLDDEHYALGSLGNGVYIIDSNGRLCMRINKQHGLASNTISHLHLSSDRKLWVTTDNSLSMIDLSSPFTYFDVSHGLHNHVADMIRVGNRLYTGSRAGIHYLNSDHFDPYFERLDYLPGFSVRSFQKTRSGYFAATNNGIYQLFPDTVLTVLENGSYSNVLQLETDTTLFLLKANLSVELLESTGGSWIYHGKIADLLGEFGIFEDKHGLIWIQDEQGRGTYSIHLNKELQVKDQLINGDFDVHHFPWITSISEIEDEIYTSSDSIMLKYNLESDGFVADSILQAEGGNSLKYIYRIIQGRENELWMNGSVAEISVFPTSDSTSPIRSNFIYSHALLNDSGRYEWDNEPFRILYPQLQFMNKVYPEKNGITWFSGINGKLARYDPSGESSKWSLSKLMINEIEIPEADSILFSGNANSFNIPFTLSPELRDLRIRYSGVDFTSADSVYYRCFLEGFDSDWSSWTHENVKDYTGLAAGEYTFKVQATDYFGENLTETSFAIIKHAPWYASPLAKIVYFVLVLGFIYLVFRWRLQRLKSEKNKLEKIVKQRTLQLEKQANTLREINDAKNRFFSNISHEFRTPLTLILGYIQKLFRSDPSSERSRTYKNLDQNARQLLQLVNQLLELAKLESGRISIHPVSTSLYVLCNRLVASYHSLAENRNIFLSFDFNMDKDMCLMMDADKFQSIIQNLISNAFKFTYSGGKITFRVKLIRLVDNQATFQCLIKDTGKGISDEHIRRIFDRFYQVEPNYNEQAYGTGIGLSIVRDYVRLMDGEVSVWSKPGQGTEFTLTFTKPVAAVRQNTGEVTDIEPVHFEDPDAEDEPSVQEEGVTVLVVEDNASMREYIREILAEEYHVALASDGRHGLDCAIRILPDLVISDVMMPKLDGIQLLAELKGDIRTSHIPVIMLTALSERKSRFKGLRHGADDYLVKPFDEEELKILIRNRLEQRKRLREKWSHEDSFLPKDILSLDEKFLNLVQSRVEENLGNSQFGVNELAEEVGMSRSQLHRKLTSLTNYSASNFIKAMRLQRAHLLLQAHSGTVSEIAYEVGFSSPQYFSNCFRVKYGYSPGQIKSQNTQAP